MSFVGHRVFEAPGPRADQALMAKTCSGVGGLALALATGRTRPLAALFGKATSKASCARPSASRIHLHILAFHHCGTNADWWCRAEVVCRLLTLLMELPFFSRSGLRPSLEATVQGDPHCMFRCHPGGPGRSRKTWSPSRRINHRLSARNRLSAPHCNRPGFPENNDLKPEPESRS